MITPIKAKRGIDNEAKWGRLVLGWVLGESQFPGVATADVATPTSLDDLKRQINLPGVMVELVGLDQATALTVIQDAGDAFVLRLPARDVIAQAIANLGPSPYVLPQFYAEFGGGIGSPSGDELLDQKKKLLACRLGDYSMAQCA